MAARRRGGLLGGSVWRRRMGDFAVEGLVGGDGLGSRRGGFLHRLRQRLRGRSGQVNSTSPGQRLASTASNSASSRHEPIPIGVGVILSVVLRPHVLHLRPVWQVHGGLLVSSVSQFKVVLLPPSTFHSRVLARRQQHRDTGMSSCQGFDHGGEFSAVTPCEFCQPRVGHVACAGNSNRGYGPIAETVFPKLMFGHGVNRLQERLCGRGTWICREAHGQAQQRSLGHDTCRERLDQGIKPLPRSLVVSVRINRQRHQHIAVEQPRHASASRRATSSELNLSRPLTIGNPRELRRTSAGAATGAAGSVVISTRVPSGTWTGNLIVSFSTMAVMLMLASLPANGQAFKARELTTKARRHEGGAKEVSFFRDIFPAPSFLCR